MEQERMTIEGIVETVIYRNEENGYAVLRLETDNGDSIVVVGCLPNIGSGEYLSAQGIWSTHATYGEQFHVQACERRLPAAEGAILSYLSSGTVKGIGRKTAEKIVNLFGTESFTVIESEPMRLTEIPGITKSKAIAISEDFKLQNGISRLMEFLVSHHIEPQIALILYRTYGAYAIQFVQDNPYLLSYPEFGVSFQQADRLAFSLGVSAQSQNRVEAAILYELNYNANAGHCFIPWEKLCKITSDLIGVSLSDVERAMETLREDSLIVVEEICGETACYLAHLHEAETFVTQKISSLFEAYHDALWNPDELIRKIESKMGITYAPLQFEAVATAANTPVFILTGGPGTGKTTIIRGILSMFEHLNLECALAAPTGRAAKRMSEFCGVEAKTIHRMLEMSYSSQGAFPVFGINHETPLECDVLILDEVSMVDLPLMRAVLDALKPGARLILVGDADQLPSVGPGNVLKDLIDSKIIPTVSLTQIYRQAESSQIITGAHDVNHGVLPDLTRKDGDLFFMQRRDYNHLIDTVLELCTTRLPNKLGIAPNQIQVLTTNRKYETGTIVLNRKLQEALNPSDESKPEKRVGERIFRVGDRVMQTRNNYDLLWSTETGGESGMGIFNGDIGEILEINHQSELMTIRFDDRIAHYPFTILNELELAYAMTVHKVQGCEFRVVIFVALGGSPYLLHRSVLYTAVTRAREMLILVGDHGILDQMVQNNKQRKRYSALRARLATLA